MWQDDSSQLHCGSSQFGQRRCVCLRRGAWHAGERDSRPAGRLHASRAGPVWRVYDCRDARVFRTHLQAVTGLCRGASELLVQAARPTAVSSLRQDIKWRPAAARLVCCRSLSRAGIAHSR